MFLVTAHLTDLNEVHGMNDNYTTISKNFQKNVFIDLFIKLFKVIWIVGIVWKVSTQTFVEIFW